MSIAQSQPGKEDDVTRIHKDSVVPACKQQKGFKGLYLLKDAKTGKGITLSLWDTEADMHAAEASGFYQAQVAKFKDILAAVPVREEYEVVLTP